MSREVEVVPQHLGVSERRLLVVAKPPCHEAEELHELEDEVRLRGGARVVAEGAEQLV